MNEQQIFKTLEDAVIRCIKENDVALPLITIAEALLQIRKGIVNGEYDKHEVL